MQVYRIICLRGDDAKEAIRLLNQCGPEVAIRHLSERYDTGLFTFPVAEAAEGNFYRYVSDKYTLLCSRRFGAIALERRLPMQRDLSPPAREDGYDIPPFDFD